MSRSRWLLLSLAFLGGGACQPESFDEAAPLAQRRESVLDLVVTPDHSASAGAASQLSVAQWWGNRDGIVAPPSPIVTTLRNGSGNLQIIAWDVGTDGSITRIGSYTTGTPAYETRTVYSTVASPITTLIGENRLMQVIKWNVNRATVPVISRERTWNGPWASHVAAAYETHYWFMTAYGDVDGNIVYQHRNVYDLSTFDTGLVAPDDNPEPYQRANEVSALSLVSWFSDGIVVSSNFRHWMRVVKMPSSNGFVLPTSPGAYGSVDKTGAILVHWNGGPTYLFTCTRGNSEFVRLDTWTSTSPSAPLSRVYNYSVGSNIFDVTCTEVGGYPGVVAVVSIASSGMVVTLYEVDQQGGIHAIYGRLGNPAIEVAAASTPTGLVTASRALDGTLQLQTWKVGPPP
jgi:hypothetical protein